MAELSKTERDGIVKANAGNRRVVDITNEHNAALKPEYAEAFFLGSSAESVGGLRLGEVAQMMVKGYA